MSAIILGELSNWPDHFKAGLLHVVCVAEGGLTVCDFVASTLGGMKQEEEVWPLTKRVNSLGETGTFWPRFALTVIPQITWEGRSAPSDIDGFLNSCFLDVAKANREYIKLDTMLVDLNGYHVAPGFERACKLARAVLSQEPSIKELHFAKLLT